MEYIESSGTQYIDTGISGNNDNLRIVMKFNLLNFRGVIYNGTYYDGVLGNYVGENSNTVRLLLSSNNANCTSGNTCNVLDIGPWINTVAATGRLARVSIGLNTDYTVDMSQTHFSINNQVLSLNPVVHGTVNPRTILLFGVSSGGTSNGVRSHVRVYNFSIYDNNILVRNLIPAKRDSDGVIGMYDTVTNTFKTNAGSGTFIAGPVVTMKIATKKYNDTMFSPVKTRVNNVSSTLDNIVSTTLTQATTVNTLKNSKQNRPNSVCPTGKKCLLVRDVNGNDNWYEIVGADAVE